PGGAYLPMHWGAATLAGRASAGINAVTAKVYCPVSKQPELKHAAVRIARAELPWKLVAFGFPDDPVAIAALRDALRLRAGEFDYASVVLIGGARAGVLLRAAASATDPALVREIDAQFALHGADVAR